MKRKNGFYRVLGLKRWFVAQWIDDHWTLSEYYNDADFLEIDEQILKVVKMVK